MIPFDEALRLVLGSARLLGTERVPFHAATGRVLAEDVRSDVAMPPFDRSAMDGFACRAADLERELAVIEEIPAGRMPERAVGPGTCSRIMTGAPVPAGADRVVRLEDTASPAPGRVRVTRPDRATNICPRGEDVREGDVVLRAGDLLGPAGVAVLAACGCPAPLVARRPRLAVLSTGSELVGPEARPAGAQIRDSNGPQLAAQAAALGLEVRRLDAAPDAGPELERAVRDALGSCDLLLVSGGVSAGDYDLVPQVLERAGFRFLFTSVAMQPGKPTVFAADGARWCCGLPGNPAAGFVAFELLVKPFVYACQGHAWRPRTSTVRLEADVRWKTGERQVTVPVELGAAGSAVPVDYHGSAHIHALSRAQALLVVPAGAPMPRAGDLVHVRPL